MELSEFDKLRLIYKDIIRGSSYSETEKFHVRHLSELDNIDITNYKIRQFNYYLENQLMSEEQKVKWLIENEEWTKQQEDQIVSLKYIISDNLKNIDKIIPEQRAGIQLMINQKKDELANLLIEKKALMGITADEYSEKDAIHFFTYLSMYRDMEGKSPYFASFEEFEDCSDEAIKRYVNEIDSILKPFTESQIRKISALPFFLNPFSYCKDSVTSFLKIPMHKVTNYQMLLLSLGSRNINILSQSEGQPPEFLDKDDLDKIVNWYDQQSSIIAGKRNTKQTK